MKLIKSIIFLSIASFLLLACGNSNESKKTKAEEEFPILGRKQFVERQVNGKTVTDTLDHTVPDFRLVNQDSVWVTPETFSGKVYIADFFFTSCPTICPTMKKEMLRVYEAYKDNDEVAIISHTIDPEYDTVALLKDFAERLDVEAPKWHFVTGEKEEIYELGQKGYMVTALEDENEEGGFIHSGAFILVDKERKIRGVYDGTQSSDVDQLIKDIQRLLATYDAPTTGI
ncbi:SCO family protein [Marivirga sp. S37H4]|uniref:SCO family protein n=1 Tax=Marivirga aurantiaca TaxID=2802615 RepID=A0A934WVC5_9BACT|nr:SCO family protein [Marivirga aurantiaca]MBK6263611.1 SCO family protein [Marivirga aurantiaca]